MRAEQRLGEEGREVDEDLAQQRRHRAQRLLQPLRQVALALGRRQRNGLRYGGGGEVQATRPVRAALSAA